ncbi:MAG: LCP family protein, partial [Solirubrobacteraceae bacterium]
MSRKGPNGRKMLWRSLLAAILVVGASAAITSVAGLLQVKTFVGYLSAHPGIKTPGISLPKPGKPQTILLIGSDHRAGTPVRGANTDTMLLVRLNARSSTINVMSIPRDLQVNIPGYGSARINSAYSVGGYGLLLRTIREDVFPGFRPNHIVDTNFTGFSDLVDAIGCVYADVDHRYYNQSAPGPDNYSSIDIQPGYQKLCGNHQSVHGALPFVRFRHTDSDIVRSARQQDFIRWAKDQYPVSKLFSNRDNLLRIFGNHSTLDTGLQSTHGLLLLFDLVLASDVHAIKQIKFPAILPTPGVGPSYVTAVPSAERAAYARFIAPTLPKPKPAGSSSSTSTSASLSRRKASKIPTAGLNADVPDGRSQAAQLHRIKMPVYFPRYVVAGSAYCLALTGNCNDGAEPASEYARSYPRGYVLRDQQGHPHAAYRMTLFVNQLLGQYYGVQGTTWHNPPLLASPTGTRVV